MAAYQAQMLGLWEDAARQLAGCRVEAERLGVTNLACFACGFHVLAAVALHELDAARAAAAFVHAHFSRLGQPRLVSHVSRGLGVLCEEEGALDEAERLYREAAAPGIGAYPPVIAVISQLALLRLRRGDAAEAWELAQQAAGMFTDEAAPFEWMVRLALAEAAVALGRTDARQVVEHARQRLLALADLISSPATRAAFLERVPINVRIAELARGGV